MPFEALTSYIPKDSLPLIRQWAQGYALRIEVTRARKSKLGDYRKTSNGPHLITINGNLQANLFFLVLTHELAHLLAFERYGRKIAPHGVEWKLTYGRMILESIDLYPVALQRILLPFSRSPRANYMATPALVKYFERPDPHETKVYVETLQARDQFHYKGERYLMKEKLKKNYLCEQLGTGRIYRFSALAKVEKVKSNE